MKVAVTAAKSRAELRTVLDSSPAKDSLKTLHSDIPHLDNTTLDHDHLLPDSLSAVPHRTIASTSLHKLVTASMDSPLKVASSQASLSSFSSASFN